ncbi:hypothetical protein ACP4OV_031145 [Aristida adscensionis]
MASRSSHLLLPATALLCVLAAAAAGSTNWCEPGLVIPLNPLPGCRAYLVSRTCGGGGGGGADVPRPPLQVTKRRCCRELQAVVPYCRCGALRIMMDGVPSSAGGEADVPCSWHRQAELAAGLVSEAECNLTTIHGGPYCYALGAEGTTSD